MAYFQLLITLMVWGLVFAIIWWAITQIPVPEPFSWVIRVIFALIVAIFLIHLLLGDGLDLPRLRL